VGDIPFDKAPVDKFPIDKIPMDKFPIDKIPMDKFPSLKPEKGFEIPTDKMVDLPKELPTERRVPRVPRGADEGLVSGFSVGGAINLKNGVIPGTPPSNLSKDNLLAKNSGGFIVKTSETRKPANRKTLDRMTGMAKGGNIAVQSGEYFVDNKTIAGNPANLPILESINSGSFAEGGTTLSDVVPSLGGTNSNNSGNNVDVGGVRVDFSSDSSKSRKDNTDALINATLNEVEQRIRRSIEKEQRRIDI
jgi:hypothetical protein